ncbi:MAG: HEAT repeat domain-containing protein [Longimicrobiales bacterium]
MSKINSNNPGVWALTLAAKDGLQRRAAREKLVAMGREATPVLIHLLEDPDSGVRWEAALALKDLGDPAAVEAMVEALKDENGDVRWVAAEGLAALGEASLRPLLRGLMADVDSFELREAAHVAISLLHDEDQQELLAPVYRALKDGQSAEMVMTAAAEALEALAGKEESAA